MNGMASKSCDDMCVISCVTCDDAVNVSCLMLATMSPDLQKQYEHTDAYNITI